MNLMGLSTGFSSEGLGLKELFGGGDITIAPPPPPSNYYVYDSDGNVSASMTWNGEKNAYEYQENKSEDEKARIQARNELTDQMMQMLEGPPEERARMYDEYAKAYSDAMHRKVDPRLDRQERQAREGMNARGLFGSRAYVDAMAERDKKRKGVTQDIADKAVLMREELAHRDKGRALGVLQYLDSARRGEEALDLQRQGVMGGRASNTSGLLTDQWGMETNAKFSERAADQAAMQSMIQNGVGLAFLGGYLSDGQRQGKKAGGDDSAGN